MADPDVGAVLAKLERERVAARVWERDHTVWKPGPEEISNRLGWLTVWESMGEQVPSLRAFAAAARAEGCRDVVLLGMGGSSLGPEVLRRVFGPADGHPRLTVLDSTLPEVVRGVESAIDPARTLFLVSSKSGTTIEPLSFYKHFRDLLDRRLGREKAGRAFAAITDPGTPLEEMAREHGFRRVFANPPDIGGRYSVLSYFGLVPAALMGVDLELLLARAGDVAGRCGPATPVGDNPGALLGAAIEAMAAAGRDKLTLVASPQVAAFGLWVEQLLAESTGKEGRGIVPVVGEPLSSPDRYGGDRLFVHLRLEGDDNAAADAALEAVERSGHPVIRLDLRDVYDMGGEFFRWEFATAVAGALLGINPFDQPDVQGAKDATDRMMDRHRREGRLPGVTASEDLWAPLGRAAPGDYLAIMAYLPESPEVDEALDRLRRSVLERYGIATTAGYGPRYLHSSGQLHKGGPNTVICLRLTAGPGADLPVPGEPYTFDVLSRCQSLGDLEALHEVGRRVSQVTLRGDPAAHIRRLADLTAQGGVRRDDARTQAAQSRSAPR